MQDFMKQFDNAPTRTSKEGENIHGGGIMGGGVVGKTLGEKVGSVKARALGCRGHPSWQRDSANHVKKTTVRRGRK